MIKAAVKKTGLKVTMHICGDTTDRLESLVRSGVDALNWDSKSDWHPAFPGTLSLSMETLTQVLREIMLALVEHGFKRFIWINPHIKNEAPIW